MLYCLLYIVGGSINENIDGSQSWVVVKGTSMRGIMNFHLIVESEPLGCAKTDTKFQWKWKGLGTVSFFNLLIINYSIYYNVNVYIYMYQNCINLHYRSSQNRGCHYSSLAHLYWYTCWKIMESNFLSMGNRWNVSSRSVHFERIICILMRFWKKVNRQFVTV